MTEPDEVAAEAPGSHRIAWAGVPGLENEGKAFGLKGYCIVRASHLDAKE